MRSRVSMINAVRSTLKSLGYRISNPSSERFHKTVTDEVPEEVASMIAHNVSCIEILTVRIRELGKDIETMARERYPDTIYLQQVAGVGPVTSLYFVLRIEDPNRFPCLRDVGAFLGLCPKRDQSGDTEKELRISKCGDPMLRRLLVNCAQYITGPFGPDSELRDFGLRLAGNGSARAKKKAVIAVSRKLAVLLLTLWKNREHYEPFHGECEPV